MMGGLLSLSMNSYRTPPGSAFLVYMNGTEIYNGGFVRTQVLAGYVDPNRVVTFSAVLATDPGQGVQGENPIASAAYGTMGLNSEVASVSSWFPNSWIGGQRLSLGMTLVPDTATAIDLHPASGPP